MNYLQYAGAIPAGLLAIAAVTQPTPDSKSQLLELGYAVLGLLSTLVLPYVISRVRKLTLEIKHAKNIAASSEDMDVLSGKIAALDANVLRLQTIVDVTTEERDALLKERAASEKLFQETLLQMKNEAFVKEQKLHQELEDERQLNSNLSRQYDQLARDFRELKEEVATMRGANTLADQIMTGINALLRAQGG